MTDLERVLGSACRGRSAGPADAVDGVATAWVAEPASTAEVAELVRAASGAGLTVVPRGTGSKLRWGMPPERADVVVDLRGLDSLVEYAPGDLVVVTGAGRTLDTLAADLGAHRQRLGIDPPRRGTVGGAVAAGVSGPLRLVHGAVRDLVIGMAFVRADGVVARSGGTVVKNVAGYDLGKLLTGSLGTLGVVTEVAFRLHPVPACTRWIVGPAPVSRRREQVQALAHAQVAPSAVELHTPPVGEPVVAVQLEGTEAGVAGRVPATLGTVGPGAAAVDTPPDWWGLEPAGEVLLRATHTIGGAASFAAALSAAAEAAGVRSAVTDSALVGTAAVRLGGGVDAAGLTAYLRVLRSRAGEFDGTCIVQEAPAAVREGVDVWGPVRALDLMRAVKDRLDPGRVLAPGRFVGGI